MKTTRRINHLGELRESISRHRFGPCLELCFRILYGLPFDIQAGISVGMVSRFLEIFENRFSGVMWPRMILNEPIKKIAESGRDIPQEPSRLRPADAAFMRSLDAVLLAYSDRDDDAIGTTSLVCAIDYAIEARRSNVWEADSPSAVQRWKSGKTIPGDGTSLCENAASIAVAAREWNLVAEEMSAKIANDLADTVDIDKMEEILGAWKEREMSLLVR